MMKLIAIAATAAALSSATAVDISVNSAAGRKLLQNAQPVADSRQLNENENADYSFLSDYAVKFQGCHHVQQWNDYADEENDVKIMTKRLARFRLCPADQCSHDKSVGCTSKFGDYIVDMDTFVEAYLTALEEDKDTLCADVSADCSTACGDGGDADCLETCFANYNLQECYSYYYGGNNNNNGNDDQQQQQMEEFNVAEYAACAQFDLPENNNNNNNNNNGGRQLEEDAAEYFIGAFCADQGGEIHLGLFTDDTCTTFASNGNYLFEAYMGFAMPYSDSSLVTTRCVACGENNYNNGENNNNNNNQANNNVNEVCTTTYELAGKCETRMAVDYPNESSCNYIEGIKIIREDGVIRTSATKKSKTAAVAIGLFTTMSVLLAAYVFYLRTKLARAQINLAASSQPLT